MKKPLENKIKKTKTLFDHLDAITFEQNPKYWDTLEDADKKTWSNYMIIRYLSMRYDWVQLVSEIQPYIQELSPRALYLTLIGAIPKGKGKVFIKYMKPNVTTKYEEWLIKLVAKWYSVSELEAEEYLSILYLTKSGKEHILKLCELYGTETKLIKSLHLKI